MNYSYFKGTSISINSVCNRDCSYCDINDKKRSNISISSANDISNIFNKLKENVPDISNWDICIEGGEPGLSPKESIQAIFDSNLTKSYHFYTNGLFIDKYYELYKDKISYIGYHLDEEKILNNEEVKLYKNITDTKIDYYLVLTKDTYIPLRDFIEKNSELNFELRLEQPRKQNHKIDFDLIQKVLDYYEPVKKSVGDFFFDRLTGGIKFNNNNTLYNKQMICSNFYRHFLIDIPNNEIHRCNISYTGDKIELTDSNLKKAYINEQCFPNTSDKCLNCLALNVTRDINIDKQDFKYLAKAKKIINKGF